MIEDVFKIMTSLFSAVAALGAVLMSFRNSRKIQEVKVTIDGRMDQLLKLTGESQHAAGMKHEKQDVADALARAREEGEVTIPEQQLKIETPREK